MRTVQRWSWVRSCILISKNQYEYREIDLIAWWKAYSCHGASRYNLRTNLYHQMWGGVMNAICCSTKRGGYPSLHQTGIFSRKQRENTHLVAGFIMDV